jgi:hypothetical protein
VLSSTPFIFDPMPHDCRVERGDRAVPSAVFTHYVRVALVFEFVLFHFFTSIGLLGIRDTVPSCQRS